MQELNVDDVVHFVGLDDCLEVEHVSGHHFPPCSRGRGVRPLTSPQTIARGLNRASSVATEGEDDDFASVDEHGSAAPIRISPDLK